MRRPNPSRPALRALMLSLPMLAALAASAEPAPVPRPAAPASASPASTAPAAHAALGAYLALWTGAAPTGSASPFSADMVLRYAHGNPPLQSEVRGRDSALTQIRAVARLGTGWRFDDLRLFPTLHEQVYFAQYTARGRSASDGVPHEQVVVLALELDGPQLVRIVEFANPAIVLASGAAAR